jgi:hypothetical protein
MSGRKKKNIEQNDDETEEVKKISNKKKTPTKRKVKKVKDESEDDEDELSDINIENENNVDEIINEDESIKKIDRQIKKIDPKTPIGELKIPEIFNYLINLGEENYNPRLRFGMINLLKELMGQKRHYNNHRFQHSGSKNNGTYIRPSFRGGRGRRGPFIDSDHDRPNERSHERSNERPNDRLRNREYQNNVYGESN